MLAPADRKLETENTIIHYHKTETRAATDCSPACPATTSQNQQSQQPRSIYSRFLIGPLKPIENVDDYCIDTRVVVAEVSLPSALICPFRPYVSAAAATAAAATAATAAAAAAADVTACVPHHTPQYLCRFSVSRDHAAFVVPLVPTRENPACKMLCSRNPAGPDKLVINTTGIMTAWGSPAGFLAKEMRGRGGNAKTMMAKKHSEWAGSGGERGGGVSYGMDRSFRYSIGIGV